MSTLKADLAKANGRIAELEQELAAEKAAHQDTMAINEGLQQQIEELELAAKTAPKASGAKAAKVSDKTFKVEKVDYVITVPAFRHGGLLITAEQLLENKELQAELVNDQVGFIKRKGDK